MRFVCAREAAAVLAKQEDGGRGYPKTGRRDAGYPLERRRQSAVQPMRALGTGAKSFRADGAWSLDGF
jgi:hypothetical protein